MVNGLSTLEEEELEEESEEEKLSVKKRKKDKKRKSVGRSAKTTNSYDLCNWLKNEFKEELNGFIDKEEKTSQTKELNEIISKTKLLVDNIPSISIAKNNEFYFYFESTEIILRSLLEVARGKSELHLTQLKKACAEIEYLREQIDENASLLLENEDELDTRSRQINNLRKKQQELEIRNKRDWGYWEDARNEKKSTLSSPLSLSRQSSQKSLLGNESENERARNFSIKREEKTKKLEEELERSNAKFRETFGELFEESEGGISNQEKQQEKLVTWQQDEVEEDLAARLEELERRLEDVNNREAEVRQREEELAAKQEAVDDQKIENEQWEEELVTRQEALEKFEEELKSISENNSELKGPIEKFLSKYEKSSAATSPKASISSRKRCRRMRSASSVFSASDLPNLLEQLGEEKFERIRNDYSSRIYGNDLFTESCQSLLNAADQLREVDQQQTDYIQQLKSAQEEQQRMQQALEEEKNKIDGLKTQLTDLKDDYNTVKNDLATWTSCFTNKKPQQVYDEFSKMKIDLQEISQKINSPQKSGKTTNNATRKNKELKKLEEENQKLKRKIEDLSSDNLIKNQENYQPKLQEKSKQIILWSCLALSMITIVFLVVKPRSSWKIRKRQKK